MKTLLKVSAFVVVMTPLCLGLMLEFPDKETQTAVSAGGGILSLAALFFITHSRKWR